MAKSKDAKKEMTKTNRRKVPAKTAPPVVQDGFTPAEFVSQMDKTSKNRQHIHDLMRPVAAYASDALPRKGYVQHRLTVPYADKRRMRIGHDEDYFPGEFIKLESCEYDMTQAPTKENARIYWKALLQDQAKLLVCLLTEDEFTTGDDVNKCYQYWPTEVDQPMYFEHSKGKITVVLKSKEGGSFGNVKYTLEFYDEKADEKKGEPSETDNPNPVQSKIHTLTIHHFTNWPANRPETGHPLQEMENLARFFQDVNKSEIDLMRKAMENFVPAVYIQTMDCVNRGGVAWVILMLLKDVEKRECFDVLDLIKKIQKIRPGSLSTYYSFSCCLAIALHIAIMMKWCEKDCQTALADLMAKFPERKVNEVGNLLVT